MTTTQPTTVYIAIVSSGQNAAVARASNEVESSESPRNFNQDADTFFTEESKKLRKIGVINIMLACGVCASDLIALQAESNSPSSIYSGLWSAMLFGLLNGIAALKATSTNRPMRIRYVQVNYCLSLVSMTVHTVPLTCAVVSLVTHTMVTWPNDSHQEKQSDWCLLLNDCLRTVMCALLLVFDNIQFGIAAETLRYYGNSTASESSPSCLEQQTVVTVLPPPPPYSVCQPSLVADAIYNLDSQPPAYESLVLPEFNLLRHCDSQK